MAKKVKPKPLLIVLFLLIILLVLGGGLIGSFLYLESPVDKGDTKEVVVTIESGTNSEEIGKILKEKDLIRSVSVFKLRLKLDHVTSLKASTYRFQKSMSLKEIVRALEKGVISNEGDIKITFRDGERITDYSEEISKRLGISYEDVLSVMKDKEFIQTLIPKYWFLTDEILQDGIYYPLEGYLAPNTYYFKKEATVEDVIIRLLDQMEDELEEYRSIIEENPHYYLTMASIVQLEGTNTENREMIVGVFQNRLAAGMNLGSDVTTYYALQESMKVDLSADQFATVNPYNTRGANMGGKMPIGPICNPNSSSVLASTHPTKNDYYFFVADKHGNIYYTKTSAEHAKKVAEIKENGDWIFG